MQVRRWTSFHTEAMPSPTARITGTAAALGGAWSNCTLDSVQADSRKLALSKANATAMPVPG
jgi:hypothetical protein